MSVFWNGEVHRVIDGNEHPSSLSEPDDDGTRHAYHVCCDCGAVHLMSVLSGYTVRFKRERGDTADQLSRLALDAKESPDAQ